MNDVCFHNLFQLLAASKMVVRPQIMPGGGGGEGGGRHSLVSSVPMRDQKNDEKGYFFSRRAVRSADII